MTHTAGRAADDDSEILRAAIALAPQIRAASVETEQGRRLPPQLSTALKDAGVFGMAMPRAWGGPELDPMTQFRVIEALAMEDGSVGWCAMIGCDTGYVSAFLDQEVARSMFPDRLAAMGAAATPTGTATIVPGGYRISGRFPFVSGCHHCAWLWLGCQVVENGSVRLIDGGIPETRQCLVRLEQCEILDTWYTTGLRGTGSNDVAVYDQFVAREHSFSFQDPAVVKRPGPLYAFPFMFAAKGPAVALGVARHALDILIESAGKPARRYTIGERIEGPKQLRDDVFVQEATARADALVTSARAHLFAVAVDMWETLVAGDPLSELQVARFTTLNGHVSALCVEAVQLVFKAAGGTAVYQKGPLDPCLRDVLTLNQHVVASLRTWEMSGRLLLGLDPLRWLF
jgi:alkylation response protein AidB-like acyl-CoA dehydrogenase